MTMALLDRAPTGAPSVPLFAVTNTAELALYRALGVPSTLASGLRRPCLSALHRFADAQEPPAPQLVFVAGSLRQMSERMSRHTRFTLSQLARDRERLGLNLAMRGWRLDQDLLEHWKHLLRWRDQSMIVEWLTDCEKVFVDFEDIVDPVPTRAAEPPNYVQARRARFENSRLGPNGLPLLDSHSKFHIALESAVVEPLLERAILIADPHQRAMHIAHAELTGMLGQLRHHVAGVLSHGTLPFEAIKSYLMITRQVEGSIRASLR
jgi:hypothetical protein